MKSITTYLEQLGFSRTEIRLYFKLLAYGEMTVAELAEAAKINRTAAYTHIDSLLKKGIVTQVRGTTNKISANSPEQLAYLVDQKLGAAKILEDRLPSIITSLNTAFPKSLNETKSEIKYFEGRSGAKAIYKECFNAKKLRSYFSATDVEKVFPENFRLFEDAFIYNKEITMYELYENSQASKKYPSRKENRKRYFWKLLPEDVKLTSNDILIYDGKVAIINIRDKDKISGVVLQNADYYNNSVQLFDLLWRLLPEPTV